MSEERRRVLLERTCEHLLEEMSSHGVLLPPTTAKIARDGAAGRTDEELWIAFRSLVNMRPPWPASSDFLADQDGLLSMLVEEAGIATVADAEPAPCDARMRLWRGDITTLAVDAIVNAANSAMTGCWSPLHYCIDNAIHTFAGVQLRRECACAMEAQGHPEPTGRAKVTGAYNLPAKHVIHTVGPIANGRPSAAHRKQLAGCYTSCLEAAFERGFHSLAFCCVSTGVFGFPQEEAATIAVSTVTDWLCNHETSSTVVVFNVFSEEDERIYRNLLAL